MPASEPYLEIQVIGQKDMESIPLVFVGEREFTTRHGNEIGVHYFVPADMKLTLAVSGIIDESWKPADSKSDDRYPRLVERMECRLVNDGISTKIPRTEIELQCKSSRETLLKIGHKSVGIVRFRVISQADEDKMLRCQLLDVLMRIVSRE